MQTITEGKVKLKVDTAKIVSKDMPVFYNPVMELNRTISILLLNSLDNKNMQMALPLAGTGIRGMRFLKELKKGKIKNISFNDYDKTALKSIQDNLKLNSISIGKNVILSNQDANLFMLNSLGFDYIEIDPFGTPNPFLDSAIKRLSRGGILAITATDTSALSGTYFKACVRKYWARPLRNEIMHEIGLRILIRKCQLIGAQFDKALRPIYSYSKDHYMRVFFACEKGKEKVDEVLKQHGLLEEAGPMWLGMLWDAKLSEKIFQVFKKQLEDMDRLASKEKELLKFLDIIKRESKITTIGFYDLPSLVKGTGISDIPRQDIIVSAIKKKGYKVSLTHFKENSLRSDISKAELTRIIKSA